MKKAVCYLSLTAVCAFAVSLPVQAQFSQHSSTNIPISSLDVNGVNLDMSIGQIVRVLEGRGYEAFRNAVGYRIAGKAGRDSEVMQIRVPLKNGTFADSDMPSMIMYNYVGEQASGQQGSAPVCDVVEGVVRKICPSGKDALPCVTRGGWLTDVQIFNQQNADYTKTYGLKAKIDGAPSRVHCTVTVDQSGTGLPQGGAGAYGGARGGR